MTQINNKVNTEKPGAKLAFLRPFVDVHENEEGVLLLADLPGVDTEQLDIQVDGNVLSLEGKVVLAAAEEGVKKELEMIPEGVYKRSFTLGDGLDFDRIDAELKSGLLKITVPKKVAEVPQKITVRAA